MVRRPSHHAAERERFVEDLLAIMTVEEKAGQLAALPVPDPDNTAEIEAVRAELRRGRLGTLVGRADPGRLASCQKLAIEGSRLGIPMLFADTPGRGTGVVMPAPLALAATWSPATVTRVARTIAAEARAAGNTWLLAPEVGLNTGSDDRVLADCWGESEVLARFLAAATIRGYQADDSDDAGVLACLRTDSASWTDRRTPELLTEKLRLVAGILRETPPGSVALGRLVESGNDAENIDRSAPPIAGPGSFDGIDLAEWSAIARAAGHTAPADLLSAMPVDAIVEAVTEGRIPLRQLDDAVRKVLGAKYDLDLFRTQANGATKAGYWFPELARETALDSARHAIVLLRNAPVLLPLDIASGEILLVGHAAADRGLPNGEAEGEAASLVDGLEALGLAHRCVPGLALREEGESWDLRDADNMAIGMASEAARRAGTVIVALGPCSELGAAQRTLLESLHAINPNIVLVTLGSRPLDPIVRGTRMPCVLHAGQLGSMSGHAIAEVLTGEFAPRGRLPLALVDEGRLGLPLGHGMGYCEFALGETGVELSYDRIILSTVLKNRGPREGTATVQLYLRRPDRRGSSPAELADFQRISLMAGETRRLMFEVSGDHLGRFERNGRFVVQPGPYDLALGLSEQQARPTSVAVLPTLAETMTRAMAAGPLPALFDRLRDTG